MPAELLPLVALTGEGLDYAVARYVLLSGGVQRGGGISHLAVGGACLGGEPAGDEEYRRGHGEYAQGGTHVYGEEVDYGGGEERDGLYTALDHP